MGMIWPKVIRDPVHGIIPFEDTECDRLLLDLINTREFQRLRRIKQLGMSELVFPGANHSRFSHSIGVMHVARKMLDRAERLLGDSLRDDQRTAVLVAALLHDVGHGPFSHAFEKVTGEKHEVRTLEIIGDDSTEVYERLTEQDPTLPSRLAVFFDEDIDEEKREQAEIPAYLTQVVSSQLDADRFDYLLRDSYATGTDYGRYDLEWLILQLRHECERDRFYLGKKALPAAEAYVYARYHMYRAVYFHKTSRAAELMVRLLFKRYRELLQNASSEGEKQAIVPSAPASVFRSFSESPTLQQYLLLDDFAVTEFFKSCQQTEDRILSSLATGLVNRRLLKATDASDADGESLGKFVIDATSKVHELNLNPDYDFVSDTAADTPYKPYDPDADKPASQIYMEAADGRPLELSSQSEPVAQLKKRYIFLRYYYPESIRDDIDKIAADTLGKEART